MRVVFSVDVSIDVCPVFGCCGIITVVVLFVAAVIVVLGGFDVVIEYSLVVLDLCVECLELGSHLFM